MNPEIHCQRRHVLKTLAISLALGAAYLTATRATAGEARYNDAAKPRASASDETCVAIISREPKMPPGVMRAWAQTSKLWPQGAKLRVLFLSGDKSQQDAAWKRAQVIDNLINLTFERVTSPPAEIRVRFDAGKGHWSMLGRDALNRKGQTTPTMNLALKGGFFGGDLPDEWDRVAIHEICHAIGLEHEHQSPLATQLVWNKPAVYAYYAQMQGWTQQQTDFQVINRSRATNILTTGWDPRSIMEYPIPQGLANVVIGWNLRLTDGDKALLQRVYPVK